MPLGGLGILSELENVAHGKECQHFAVHVCPGGLVVELCAVEMCEECLGIPPDALCASGTLENLSGILENLSGTPEN